jgi:type IV pilus assembly protein PilC
VVPPARFPVFDPYRLGVLVLFTLLGALATIADEGPEAIVELVEPGLFGLWLILVARHQRYKPAAVFATLQARIDAGHSLSESMARLPIFFPKDLVSLVGMAEKTGKLDTVLDTFSGATLKQWTAQRELSRVLRYIGISFAIQGAVATFMVVKVMSIFEETLLEVGADPDAPHHIPGLHIPLPSLMDFYNIANFISVHKIHVVGICWLIALWLWMRPKRKRRNWASRFESTALLLIPGLHGLLARQNLGTITFMLHELLRAGVPLEQALDTVQYSDLHPLYKRWVGGVRRRILNGVSLREACSGTQLLAPIPRSFVGLIAMGETHGRLENSLNYLAEQYQAQVERRKKLLMGCVLPVGVFSMGYVVLAIEASMFQALVDLADAFIL